MKHPSDLNPERRSLAAWLWDLFKVLFDWIFLDVWGLGRVLE